MKRLFALFIAVVCVAPIAGADAAIQVKKADVVSSTSSSSGGSSGTASLVPTVVGLVSGVIALNAQQNALSAECIPTTAEMNFVDNTMKEWAKTGQMTAAAYKTMLRREPCQATDNGYATAVQTSAGAAGFTPCYNSFASASDEKMIWKGYPKTGKGTYCKSGAYTCSGNDLITISDTYDIFNLIGFGPADYTPTEATMAAKLLTKVESCSSARLSAKKKALWGEFLTTTAGSIGQKTNTGTIMDQVGVISSGGGAGALQSLGAIATQFMN